MTFAERLKRGLILSLVLLYATTTPLLAASHVHLPAVGSHHAAVAVPLQHTGPIHGTFCEICFRVTTSSPSPVHLLVAGFQLPAQTLGIADETWCTLSGECVTLPPRAPPLPRS